jgi:hypothetical protein
MAIAGMGGEPVFDGNPTMGAVRGDFGPEGGLWLERVAVGHSTDFFSLMSRILISK